MQIEHLKDTIVGAGSVGMVEVTGHIAPQLDLASPSVIQIVIQLIITVATLIKLFKKPNV
jgi:hypothetical protein